MRLPESVLAGGPWAGVALVQITLVSLLGLLAWLAARRSGPALRGAVLLATLVGLLVVPGLAAVAPVWLPLPDWVGPAGPGAGTPAPPPPAPADPTVLVLVTPPPAEVQLNPEDPTRPAGDTGPTRAGAEAAVINLSWAPEDPAPAVLPSAPPPPSRPLVGWLAAAWLLGALGCLTRALVRLVLLYRCAGRARAVPTEEWTGGVASLTECGGGPAVSLRESAAVASPLTLGLFRPVILLPPDWRTWPAEQRTLILGHELAHVRRRDFLAGLVAELAACLCWFHPLVRWLAGRLRLEQEYAADAWVVSATTDAADYVRCLARLALAQGGGGGPLAPTFWRRRPEILRRIDMLRRNPKGLPPRLGRRAAWTVAVLATLACLAVAGVGPLRSAADAPKPAPTDPRTQPKATTDPNGDALPEGATARLGTTRWRHGAEVTFVAFGPDGKTLLTAGHDNTIRLWDLASGKEIRRFTRPKPAPARRPGPGGATGTDKKDADAVAQIMVGGRNGAGNLRVALAPDGKTLAAAAGNVVQLWDVRTGEELRRIEGPEEGLGGLLFSPDGRTLAGRTGDDTFFLWAADTGKEIRRIKPPPRPPADGIVLVFGGGDDDGDAPGMAFTPDGKVLAAAVADDKPGEDGHAIRFWDLASGKEVRHIKVAEEPGASTLAFAPDGAVLAYGAGGVVHLCAADTGKEVRKFESPDRGIVALVFTPDGKALAVRGRNQRVRLWETETGKELRRFGDAETAQRGGGLAFVTNASAPETRALALSRDGKYLAAAAGSTVRVWQTATGEELPLLGGHRRAPTAIVLAPDGKTVISWGADRVIRRWEAASGKPLGATPAPAGTTLAALSPDGRTVALANADNTIRLHDAVTGEQRHRLETHRGGVAALAFTRDGKVLASRGSADNAIRLYDVAGGAELRQITVRPGENPGGRGVLILGGPARAPRGTAPGLAFSPDGKLLVATGPGGDALSKTLVFFDVATGKELRKIESSLPVASFAFSPDGRTLAAENADRTITLWEVASGKERERLGKPAAEAPQRGGGMMAFAVTIDGMSGGFNEPAGPVGLTFSPDGRALVVRGPGPAVRLWDVGAGAELGQLKGDGGRVETVAFAPDGKALASGSTDTTILLWDAAGALKGLAKPPAGSVTAAEVESLWADLAGEDAGKALRSVQKLAGAPGEAVPFLGGRLKPAARVDPQKIAGWIADLESEKFTVRREAAANLLKVGAQAVPALRAVLASSPPLETRRRVEDLLDRLTTGTLTTEQLRVVRAVEALERMGTPEARRLLRTLAEGAPGELPTREAQAALERMKDQR